MRAAVIERFGPSSELGVRELPTPEPGPAQVLIEVHAAGVNPIDWKIRDGLMSARYGEAFPMILGFDASGIVSATGEGVTEFEPGDSVFARSDLGAGGCYAESAVLNTSTVAHKPQPLTHVEAAAMPLAGLTALNGLRDPGRLGAGQRVLIIGASGGVGIYAVQIAKNLGAHVTAVCSQRNLDLAAELGADRLLDYTQQGVLETDARYDVIYDTVGSQEYSRARQALRDDGVYLTLVPTPDIEFFVPGQTERQARGGYFLVWAPTAQDLQQLANWADAGQLRSVIDSVYPLEQVRDAHERSQTLRARGKIVLRIHANAH